MWPNGHSWRDRFSEVGRLSFWDVNRVRVGLTFVGIIFPIALIGRLATHPSELFEDPAANLFFLVFGVAADLAIVKGLDARLDDRAAPDHSVATRGFLEMLNELGMQPTRPNSIRGRADGTSHLTKPLSGGAEIRHAYVGQRDGRETALVSFETLRGTPEFRAVAITRVSPDHPEGAITRGLFIGNKDKDFPKLRTVGSAKALPHEFRQWVAESTTAIEFEVKNGWATTATNGPLDDLNAGPLVRALDRFAEALETN